MTKNSTLPSGDCRMLRHQLGDAREPRAGLTMSEVHLEAHADDRARGHQQLPVCSYSSMAATFSADAEVGSKR